MTTVSTIKTGIPELLKDLRRNNPKNAAFRLIAVKAMAKSSREWELVEREDRDGIEKTFEVLHYLLNELEELPQIE